MIDLQDPFEVIYDIVENTAVIVQDDAVVLFEGPFRGVPEAAHAVRRYISGLDVPNVTLMPNNRTHGLFGFDVHQQALS